MTRRARHDEAHVPAEQPGAQAPARLPRPHGDQGRPAGDQPPPRPRPQARLGLTGHGGGPAPIATLKKRVDFLAAARARRQSRPGFTLQARARADEVTADGIRVGYAASRKVGNAVARNRAKRRLRAAAAAVLPAHGRPGWDYVLVGRPATTATRPFAALCDDLRGALRAVHAPR
jgi:ribonuclease P protein component